MHEGVTVKSEDREDHSFNGIMFDISAGGKNKPLEFILVESVWVRGGLGPMAVYFTEEAVSFREVRNSF